MTSPSPSGGRVGKGKKAVINDGSTNDSWLTIKFSKIHDNVQNLLPRHSGGACINYEHLIKFFENCCGNEARISQQGLAINGGICHVII